MQTGMLGNNESLRALLNGPISDLLVKLNGEDGQEVLTELNKFNRREPCWVPKPKVEVDEPKTVIPNLRSTGLTFGDWLKAREGLHRFFTGETVTLRDLFAVDDTLLARTDIMPIFRPASATNRLAVSWKQKLGVVVREEVDVMRYAGTAGLTTPELYYINRSVRPDPNTLGDDAESPDGLIVVPDTLWCNLYGWSDADNLHFLIVGTHLDPMTATWFPKDRLPGNRKVARGRWSDGWVWFEWCARADRRPCIGGRVAKRVPLKH